MKEPGGKEGPIAYVTSPGHFPLFPPNDLSNWITVSVGTTINMSGDLPNYRIDGPTWDLVDKNGIRSKIVVPNSTVLILRVSQSTVLHGCVG